MKTHQASRTVVTTVLTLLGVALMVTAPLFGGQLLTGVVFFGGAALALTAIVARAKHSLMADMHPANLDEEPQPEDGEKESVLTAQDVQFLANAKIAEL